MKTDLLIKQWERPSTSLLSQLETTIGRLYLRPCLMFELFQIYKQEIKNLLENNMADASSEVRAHECV